MLDKVFNCRLKEDLFESKQENVIQENLHYIHFLLLKDNTTGFVFEKKHSKT